MRKAVDDIRLMIKACDLYYNRGVSQQQIAEALDISRPSVSRLLANAKDEGIVTISVHNVDMIKYWDLERRVKAMYKLKEVFITDSAETDEELKANLGCAAGRFLEYRIQDGNIVGVSMGATICQVVRHVTKPTAEDVTFVSLVGGLGALRMELHSNNLAGELARAYHGKFVPLHAPARVSSDALRKDMLREENVAAALRLGERSDVAIVGIGYPNDRTSSIAATGYYKENEIESLIRRKVVGEICMQFYDESGDTSPYRSDNNVIGMELRKLRKVPCSIGIAGGRDKLTAIKGAINGGYINVLITDAECAAALLAGGSA